MNAGTLKQIEALPWVVFAAYWLITAFGVKRTKAVERAWDRFLTIAVMVLAFGLLFEERLRIGPLGLRFVRGDAWIEWTGIAMTCAVVAVAIWARYCLGEYWSARVTLKEGHRIIRSGPYHWVRHPIYTGMLVGAIGRAISIGEWRGLFGAALILVTHARKAMREEALLTKEFGTEYQEYKSATGFLFPQLFVNWVRSGG
jgi:protein-S-isoprenylcysteine O-methyltransferase Ste14